MLVKLETNYAGPLGTADAGTIVMMDDFTAKELIESYQAVVPTKEEVNKLKDVKQLINKDAGKKKKPQEEG